MKHVYGASDRNRTQAPEPASIECGHQTSPIGAQNGRRISPTLSTASRCEALDEVRIRFQRDPCIRVPHLLFRDSGICFCVPQQTRVTVPECVHTSAFDFEPFTMLWCCCLRKEPRRKPSPPCWPTGRFSTESRRKQALRLIAEGLETIHASLCSSRIGR
jgi:hypothetical protein